MALDLGVPFERRVEVARRMKESFDRLEYVDSGWWRVDFAHPALGRDPAPSKAERIPGEVIPSTEEPSAFADAVIVAVGFEDPYTGEVHLGNLFTVAAGPEQLRNPPDEDSEAYPNSRLPAIALYDDGGRLMGLVGTIHGTRENRFETSGVWPELEAAIAEWAQLTARDTVAHHRR